MTTKKTPTTEDLRAQLAAAEAAEQAEAQRKADALGQAQAEWDKNYLAGWRDKEQEAIAAGEQAIEAAREAVAAGDLNTAFDRYAAWLASRELRTKLRDLAQNAAYARGVDAPGAHELRYVTPDFFGFVHEHMARTVTAKADTGFTQAGIPAYPAVFEDLAAHSGNQNGN